MTSYREYLLLSEGHAKSEQEQWERLRWQVYMEWAVSPNLKKRPRTPQDVIRFPWEKEQPVTREVEPLTEEEIQKIGRIFNIERKDISNG